jgi:hypothetical protein
MVHQTEPRFRVGDAVWALNGEPRIVTGMRWSRSMKRNEDDPDFWGWVLDTVHPDDPECKGTGFEGFYRARDLR